jgi:GGDEF domain-containing protein
VIPALAERLQAALSEPYRLGGIEVNSSASIGITLSTVGYQTADEVLRDADIAMYRAKAAGGGQHAMFHSAPRTGMANTSNRAAAAPADQTLEAGTTVH